MLSVLSSLPTCLFLFTICKFSYRNIFVNEKRLKLDYDRLAIEASYLNQRLLSQRMDEW